jgi:hypothetical protein
MSPLNKSGLPNELAGRFSTTIKSLVALVASIAVLICFDLRLEHTLVHLPLGLYC